MITAAISANWTTGLVIAGMWILAAALFAGTWAKTNWDSSRGEMTDEEWEAWWEMEAEYEDIPEMEIV